MGTQADEGRFRAVCLELQPQGIAIEAIRGLNRELAGETLIAVRTNIRQNETRRRLGHCRSHFPEDLVKADWTAVQCRGSVIGRQVIRATIEREAAARDTIGIAT